MKCKQVPQEWQQFALANLFNWAKKHEIFSQFVARKIVNFVSFVMTAYRYNENKVGDDV